MTPTRTRPQSGSSIEKTRHVIADLLNQQLNNSELANELNQRQLYMASGASWNAGRVDMFLAKHQIKPTHS
ncbi:MAG: hypothetical protein V7745_02685 [Pseudomonadales bacterium]